MHVPGKETDTGIKARWFDLTGGEPRLDVQPIGSDPTKAVLAAIAALRVGDEIVTVVLPEQFRKRSFMAAAQRAQFRLKLRLLVEPGVVVADVPAVTSERRPEGKVPERLLVRVLADGVDDATRRAVEYARLLGESDLRAVHIGERTLARGRARAAGRRRASAGEAGRRRPRLPPAADRRPGRRR